MSVPSISDKTHIPTSLARGREILAKELNMTPEALTASVWCEKLFLYRSNPEIAKVLEEYEAQKKAAKKS